LGFDVPIKSAKNPDKKISGGIAVKIENLEF
jgi:hypothetical protein